MDPRGRLDLGSHLIHPDSHLDPGGHLDLGGHIDPDDHVDPVHGHHADVWR